MIEYINRETIEKAAEEYCRKYMKPPFSLDKRAFVSGAEWRISSVWHDAGKEEPTCWELIIREDIMGDYDLGCKLRNDTVRWAYVSDLIPGRKEEVE